jgi:beta-mannosidase
VVVARIIGQPGEVVVEERLSVDVLADGPTFVGRVACSLDAVGSGIFFLDLALQDSDGHITAGQRLCFSAAADLAPLAQLPDTEFAVTMGATASLLTITNTGESPAVGVRIEDAAGTRLVPALLIEDAFFSLLPGESRTVELTWTEPLCSANGVVVSALNAPPVNAVP